MDALYTDSPLNWNGQTFNPPKPLDIGALEHAIVQQLDTFIADALGPQRIDVIHFPDNPDRYEMRHRIGVAMVIYMGSEYGPILDTGHVIQERTMEWEVGIRIRDLGWAFGGPSSATSPGAYTIVDLVRRALLGFQPDRGCTPMKAVHDRFLDRDKQGGVWVYMMRLSTRTVVVEEFQPPTTPLFTDGLMLDESGCQVTYVPVPNALYTFDPNGYIYLGRKNISSVTVQGYSQNVDYSVNHVTGVIQRISGGGILPQATVTLSYSYADYVEAT